MPRKFWPALAMILFASPGLAQEISVQMHPPIIADLLINSGSFRAGRSTVPSGHCPEGGARQQTRAVFFDPPYLEAPQVLVALNSFDFAIQQQTPRNPRIIARAESVSRVGMRLVVETWCDTNLISAGGTYLVMGRRGVLADILPSGRPPGAQGRPDPRLPPRRDGDVLDEW